MPALLLERSFLFMNRMYTGKIANHQSYTPIEELLPGSTYMYLYGPDR